MSEHKHNEAFKVMIYEDGEGRRELLWNSRDGVTPYVVATRDGKGEMHHVEWSRDRYAPDHVPEVGDRIFVDLTRDLAAERATVYVEKHWGNKEMNGVRASFSSKEEAIAQFADAWYGEGGQPALVEVTEEMREEFMKRSRVRSAVLGAKASSRRSDAD
jgi:hypothetical protein